MILSDYADQELGIYRNDNNIEYIKEKVYEGLDLVIYNTGSGGELELNIPLEASMYDIPTITVQDIFWDSKEGYKRRFENIPTYIIVMTEENKNDILEVIDIEASNIKVLGNPHFDRLSDFEIEEDDYLSVSFISQCGSGGGLNEPTAEVCKESILELLDLKSRGIITDLKIYKHPRENTDFYNDIGIEPEKSNEFSLMMKSGIIISCGSTPHYEAMLIGKRTLFSGRGSLEEKIKNGEWDELSKDIDIGKSTFRIIKFIESLNE